MSTETSEGTGFDQDIAIDLHEAVEKMFVQMFNVPVRSEFKVIDKNSLPGGDVTGMIGFQKIPRGALLVTLPSATLFSLLKNLYGKEFTEIDKTALGLVGEVTNIVYGILKSRLNNKGYKLGFGIPQVLAGGKHRIPEINWAICGSFESDAGPFHAVIVQA